LSAFWLFVIAQFAVALPSQLASAEAFAIATALHAHHQHARFDGRIILAIRTKKTWTAAARCMRFFRCPPLRSDT
jgi:hypothetical protein